MVIEVAGISGHTMVSFILSAIKWQPKNLMLQEMVQKAIEFWPDGNRADNNRIQNIRSCQGTIFNSCIFNMISLSFSIIVIIVIHGKDLHFLAQFSSSVSTSSTNTFLFFLSSLNSSKNAFPLFCFFFHITCSQLITGWWNRLKLSCLVLSVRRGWLCPATNGTDRSAAACMRRWLNLVLTMKSGIHYSGVIGSWRLTTLLIILNFYGALLTENQGNSGIRQTTCLSSIVSYSLVYRRWTVLLIQNSFSM